MTRTITSLALGALALLAAQPAAARAQQGPDPRWLPWLGCWQPTAESAAPADLLVCVRPSATAAGVDIATIVEGQGVSQRTLVGDDRPHELNEDDCSGWQRAAFSADGRRAYLRSDLACDAGVHRTASAIMAMGSSTQWLDAQSVGMDGERVPRVLRYRAAPSSKWPAEFAVEPQRAIAVTEARVLAAAPLSLADVREASGHVDRDALVAFLIERKQPFDLDAAQLEALAAAGVPDQVIDVVVAVSFPNRFHIDRHAMRMALQPEQPPQKAYADRRLYYDPFGWGYYGDCYYGSFYCDPYGYGMLGFGLGWYAPLGYYGGYGNGGYDPYWYGYGGQPIIVVGGNGGSSPGGQAVNGRGYTRGGQPAGTAGGRTAQPRGGSATQDRAGARDRGRDYTPPSSSGARSAGSQPQSPSASPRGYSRPSSPPPSSGSRRTAKPRCCAEPER